MAGQITKSATKFRTTFPFSKDSANWFPGHMAKGVKQMQQKLKMVDCIIEVHDARIPFSGRNPNFYKLLTAARPHILILNKKDLANLRHEKRILSLLSEKMNDTHVLFTNCKEEGCRGVKQILPLSIDLIKSSERFNRTELNMFHLMIIGVPNVGKSSLINSLRNLHLKKANATRVGANPGVTRAVLQKIKISEEPPVYLFDTPGVLQPNITNTEVGLKLALCDTIQDEVINIITKADFVLFWLNKHENFNYVETFCLKEPTDDIYDVLIQLALSLNRVKTIRSFEGPRVVRPDLDSAAHYFVKTFQTGKLGKVMLDFQLLKS